MSGQLSTSSSPLSSSSSTASPPQSRAIRIRTRARTRTRSKWTPAIGSILILCFGNIVILVVRPATSNSLMDSSMASILGINKDNGYVVDHPKVTEFSVANFSKVHELQQQPNPTQEQQQHTEGIAHEEAQVDMRNGKNNESSVEDEPKVFNLTTNLPFVEYGASDASGKYGYVADPKALRNGVQDFLKDHNYWELLQEYENDHREGALFHDVEVSPASVCHLGPGRSFEEDGGFKLITEKIRIDEPSEDDPRVFCAIYSYPKLRNQVRAQALSWGHKCDGFLTFSTETIPELGIIDLNHFGEEDYFNMWQKVRAIWKYTYDHYRQDYDYFHLGGDDLYVLVDNLKRFLRETERRSDPSQPKYWGQWVEFSNQRVVAGAPGYTLNRVALDMLVTQVLPICRKSAKVSYEDRVIALCFEESGVDASDTREVSTGEPQYHGTNPQHLYTFRASREGRTSYYSKVAAYWESLPHPNDNTTTTGPRHALQAAAKYSVTLHDIHHPNYVARIHSLLFPETCPASSNLGRALRTYRDVGDA